MKTPHLTKTTTHSETQLTHLFRWAENYMAVNRERLIIDGIRCHEVYAAYAASTHHPVGLKTFGPYMRHLGIDRIKKNAIHFYVLFV
jgi:hypothetical protein